MTTWQDSRRRRIDLIRRKHHGGLTDAESAELGALEAEMERRLTPIFLRRDGVLREFTSYVDGLKAKVAARKKQPAEKP